nr:unnamed protein product [Callosobruchus analis]
MENPGENITLAGLYLLFIIGELFVQHKMVHRFAALIPEASQVPVKRSNKFTHISSLDKQSQVLLTIGLIFPEDVDLPERDRRWRIMKKLPKDVYGNKAFKCGEGIVRVLKAEYVVLKEIIKQKSVKVCNMRKRSWSSCSWGGEKYEAKYGNIIELTLDPFLRILVKLKCKKHSGFNDNKYVSYYLFKLTLPPELQEYVDDLHKICVQKSGITEGIDFILFVMAGLNLHFK